MPPGELLLGKRDGQAAGDALATVGRRRPGLLVQQRQQGARSAPAIRDKSLDHGRRGQGVHQGRHRLRRLRAAGHRPAQGRAAGAGQEGQQPPLRALRLHAPGTVRDRQDQADQDVRRADQQPRPGARLRDLQAGRRLDPGQPVERERPRPRHASRTPTIASWPTSSAAARTRWCRACPAARSRPRS